MPLPRRPARTKLALATLGLALAWSWSLLPANATSFGPIEAEHLLNRAGFGGTPQEVEALRKLGRRDAVSTLLAGFPAPTAGADRDDFDPLVEGRPSRRSLVRLPEEKRREVVDQYRRRDRAQYTQFRAWWFEEMISTPHPLKEKIALFWHGYFTSAQREVRNSYHMVQQNELFRDLGLGSFRTLLHRVAKDPAMLSYLDNDQNRKGNPNENFARELMELFTLGPGHYTERDIKEAARAFTGWTHIENEFRLLRRQHDFGVKTVLGKRGRFGGEQVIDILLAQPAAPHFLATRLLGYFVGPSVSDPMVERYARLLRKHDWEIRPVLHALFTDPAFYRPEVIGNRILGPVEYIVSVSRRFGEVPPGAFLASCSELLGQSLLNPPNVKGWEGGEAWITTSTFLQRGNIATYIVQGFDVRTVREELTGTMGGGAEGRRPLPFPRRMRWIPTERIRWLIPEDRSGSPGAVVDALCDRFLGVPVTDEARTSLLQLFEERSSEDGFELPDEDWLKRLVRLILSLPEAQLG